MTSDVKIGDAADRVNKSATISTSTSTSDVNMAVDRSSRWESNVVAVLKVGTRLSDRLPPDVVYSHKHCLVNNCIRNATKAAEDKIYQTASLNPKSLATFKKATNRII